MSNKPEIPNLPNQREYKNLTPFDLVLIQKFPFIEEDFDSINMYGILSKIKDYLNNVIENEQIVTENQNNVNNSFTELHNYVEDYFTNLGVQEEIDNKLDGLVADGTISRLIEEYVNPYIERQNNEINAMNNKIQNIESATPIAVENTTQMTDTTKIYLNVTDGNWYWHDGTNWVVGGTYQAIELADNSVDILSLDNNLQDNFTSSFGDFQPLGNATNGMIKNNNGVLEIQATSNYSYYMVNLSIGSIYHFTGYNVSSMCGLLIVDSSNNILYDSNINIQSAYSYFSKIVKIKQNGLKAYLCKNNTATNDIKRNQNPTYRLLDKVSNKLFLNLTPRELESYQGYLQYNADTGNISVVANPNATAKMFAIDKGKKYRFKTFSYLIIKGLIITNENYEVQYISPQSDTENEYIYEYTANENGFAFLTKYQSHQAEIEVINETIENLKSSIIEETNEKISQQVGFSKWYAIGDSITAKTYRANKNHLTYIKEDIPSITIQNLGVSGSGYKNGNNTFIDRISSIPDYDINTDIITVMGSINDISYVSENLGQLGDTTTDTLYGCMYSFFYNLFFRFNGVRIGCISPIVAITYYNNKANWEKYFTALKETCELFNVPFLDLLHNSNLRPTNNTFLNEYYLADGEGNTGQIDTSGVHPNSKGYKLFYQRIKEFIKTL